MTRKKKALTRLRISCKALALVSLVVVAGFTSNPALSSIQGTDFALASIQGIQGTDAKLLAGSDVVTLGPVEALDVRRGTVTVLGQQYLLGDVAKRALRSLSVGDYVVTSGMVRSDGSVAANAVLRLAAMYVSGASPVYLKGRVASNDVSLGRLVVGTLAIDYTATPSFVDVSALGPGSTLELAGIQPVAAGLLLAGEAKVISVQSIAGTDSRSIAGTDARSIAGTDARSIAGTDSRSIAGTDARSIAGTDSRSIAGTDARSIAGTDSRSIAGTDARSIAGTDSRSIAGTDARSIAGTDSRSIAGTDARSIAGTDSRSIAGTDARSIAGTDSRSIAGTDARSIAGTDSRSIAGTDARSIAGTDSRSIAGTD